MFVLQLIPSCLVKVLAEERLGTRREYKKASDVLRFLEVRASLAFLLLGCSSSDRLSRSNSTTKLFLFCDHGLNAIIHVLNKVDFRPSKSALVGDIVDMISRLGVLAVDATNLNVVLVGNFLELIHLCSKLG